jgi:hypothetical protein
MDSRKRALSIRFSDADLRKVKALAERLEIRDADLIRFALKSTLSRLAPLHDPAFGGRNLVQVLAESGPELVNHFEFDAARLERIVNADVEAEQRIETGDIQLLAMSGQRNPFADWHPDDCAGEMHAGAAPATLRSYLFHKYTRRAQGPGSVRETRASVQFSRMAAADPDDGRPALGIDREVYGS